MVGTHDRAVEEKARPVDGAKPEQMGLRTPCAGWDVRELLAHIAGGNMVSGRLAQGGGPIPDPARARCVQHAPGGDGGPCLGSGQGHRSASGLQSTTVDIAVRLSRPSLPQERPPGTPLAPPVPVADDLPATDRLAAFLDRARREVEPNPHSPSRAAGRDLRPWCRPDTIAENRFAQPCLRSEMAPGRQSRWKGRWQRRNGPHDSTPFVMPMARSSRPCPLNIGGRLPLIAGLNAAAGSRRAPRVPRLWPLLLGFLPRLLQVLDDHPKPMAEMRGQVRGA